MACSWGPSPSTRQVPGSSPGHGGRAACAFFLHPPFLPPSGDSFFRTFPTKPTVRLGLISSPSVSWSRMANISLTYNLLLSNVTLGLVFFSNHCIRPCFAASAHISGLNSAMFSQIPGSERRLFSPLICEKLWSNPQGIIPHKGILLYNEKTSGLI